MFDAVVSQDINLQGTAILLVGLRCRAAAMPGALSIQRVALYLIATLRPVASLAAYVACAEQHVVLLLRRPALLAQAGCPCSFVM